MKKTYRTWISYHISFFYFYLHHLYIRRTKSKDNRRCRLRYQMGNKTAHTEYGEPNDKIGKHIVCDKCGFCIICGDCKKFGCGNKMSRLDTKAKNDEN